MAVNINFTNGGSYAASDFRRMLGSMQDFVGGLDAADSFAFPETTGSDKKIRVQPGQAWVRADEADDRQGVFWVQSTEVMEYIPNGSSGVLYMEVESPEFGQAGNPRLVLKEANSLNTAPRNRTLILCQFQSNGGPLTLTDLRTAAEVKQYLVTRTGPARRGTPPDSHTFRYGTQFTDLTTGHRWVFTESGDWHRDGSTILTDTASPTPNDGHDGDFHVQRISEPNPNSLNATRFELHHKAEGQWQPIGSLRGDKLYSGNGEPSSGQGAPGDVYLDTATGDTYQFRQYSSPILGPDGQPTGETQMVTGWDSTGNIRGPQGFQGEKGDQGIQGPQGLQGIQGEKGEKGDLAGLESYTGDINITGGTLKIEGTDVLSKFVQVGSQTDAVVQSVADLKTKTEGLGVDVRNHNAELPKLSSRVGTLEKKKPFAIKAFFDEKALNNRGITDQFIPFNGQPAYGPPELVNSRNGTISIPETGIYGVMMNVSIAANFPQGGTIYAICARLDDKGTWTGGLAGQTLYFPRNESTQVSLSAVQYFAAGTQLRAFARVSTGSGKTTKGNQSAISLFRIA